MVILGPVVGPVVGGFITDNSSWRWCFLINVPIGMMSLFLVNMYVDEPQALVDDRKKLLSKGLSVDIVGFLLVALFFGCLEVTLDRGQTDDWFASPLITTTAIIAAGSLFLFIPWELTRDEPIVPIAMFGRRNFGIASLFLLLTGVIVFGSTLFIPQLLQQVMGYTATDAGLALTAGGVATLVAMPVVGVLSGKVDARLLIGGAFVVEGLALLNMSHLNTDMSFDSAALARTYQAVGLPFLFVPISAVAYVGLKQSENNQASALMNVARNFGGDARYFHGPDHARPPLAVASGAPGRDAQSAQSQLCPGHRPVFARARPERGRTPATPRPRPSPGSTRTCSARR